MTPPIPAAEAIRGLRAAVLRVLREVEEGHLPAEMGADEVLDHVDSALFGPAAKEGSR